MNVPQNQIPTFEERALPLEGITLPEPGVVHLWLLDLAALGSPLQPGEAVDRERLTSRQLRAMRRFYLRLLLGAYLDIPGKDVKISRVIKGKPMLDPTVHGRVLDFSIAASNGCCLIGVTTDALIGVDLEWRGRQAGKPLSLAKRYFSAQEYAALQELPAQELDAAFLHTWSCKEAMVKAAGHGIANQLCRFSVRVDPEQPAAVLAMDDDAPEQWQLQSFSAPGDHLGAVTVRYPQMSLRGFRLIPRS